MRTMSFFAPAEVVAEIEHRIRQRGATLAHLERTCWISYHYQAVQPEKGSVDTLVPVFSMVSVFDEEFFLFTELATGGPITSVDVRRIEGCRTTDPAFVEKFPIYNLKNKKTKKLSFPMKIFQIENFKIYVADSGFVSFRGDAVESSLVKAILDESMRGRGIVNLDANVGFLEPREKNDLVFPFHIYEFAKRRDTATIPRPAVPGLVTSLFYSFFVV